MRVRTPWIEALRDSKKAAKEKSEVPAEHANRDLKPKKMSDSFHKAVGGQSPDAKIVD